MTFNDWLRYSCSSKERRLLLDNEWAKRLCEAAFDKAMGYQQEQIDRLERENEAFQEEIEKLEDTIESIDPNYK